MAWNQSSSNYSKKSASGSKKLSPAVKGVLALIVVWALGSLVWWFIAANDVEQPVMKETKAPKILEEVKAAKASARTEQGPKVVASEIAEPTLRQKMQGKTLEERESIIIQKLEEIPIPEETTNQTFRTGLEQVIGWVFTTELGDLPPPLPNLSDYDLVHIEEIINLKNPVRDTDSEQSAGAKETVDLVKGELKKFLEKGGGPQDFLKYYHDELTQAHMRRDMAQKQLFDVLKTDPDMALDFMDKINMSLKAQGIKEVVLPERILRRHGLTREGVR